MLVVVSPAKRLDWSPAPGVETTTPAFRADADHLAGIARGLDTGGLQRLMGISEKLAQLNRDRFAAFDAAAGGDTRPAALAFAGDTYAGLEARTLEPDARRWADRHLRILSGLYGLLRPFDAILPYRLEMGSRLTTGAGGDLYAYWGDRLAEALNAAAGEAGTGTLVNCASREYFAAVDRDALALDVVEPVFLEERGGEAKMVSFYAKKARGAMARFIAEHRLTDPAALNDFTTGGYRHDPERSTRGRPVFLREAARAAA